MMMDTMQMAVMTGLSGLLGAATTYRWLGNTGRLTDCTRKRVWFRTLSGVLVAAGVWVLLHFGQQLLPDRWARQAPFVVLIGLALVSLWKPPRVTNVERQSTRRIQVGILIGGIILIAFCLIAFWQR